MRQGKCRENAAMSCRLRATRRSRVGTPPPVPPMPVPTRLRRVAHSNGCAIRLGSHAALDGGSTAACGQPVVAGLVLFHPYRDASTDAATTRRPLEWPRHSPRISRSSGRRQYCRPRATRRSRVGTPLPSRASAVPTRLRRVAYSNGCAIRLGSHAALDGGSTAACGQPVVAGLVLRHPSLRAPVIRRKSFSAVPQGSSRAIPSSQQPARPSMNSAQCTAPRRQTCQHHATNGRTGLEPRTGPDVPEDD